MTSLVKPLKHCTIFYSPPTTVNGIFDVTSAVKHFTQYDIVVLGDGLQIPTHEYYNQTVEFMEELIAEKPGIEVYGYVDLGVTTQNLPMNELLHRALLWKAIGTTGIFLDDAGQDYGVTRERLNDAVNGVHKIEQRVFVNAWQINDILDDPTNPDPHSEPSAIKSDDLVLLESLVLNSEHPQAAWQSSKRAAQAAMLRSIGGPRFVSCNTIKPNHIDGTGTVYYHKLVQSHAAAFGLDAVSLDVLHYAAVEPYICETIPLVRFDRVITDPGGI